MGTLISEKNLLMSWHTTMQTRKITLLYDDNFVYRNSIPGGKKKKKKGHKLFHSLNRNVLVSADAVSF